MRKGLYQEYLKMIGRVHGSSRGYGVRDIDFKLRTLIGKTDDLGVAKCSHAKILENEFPDDENRCRQCGMSLPVGFARWNDYLVLRHSQCTRPICSDCAENRPDIFHTAFREGLRKYMESKITNELPLYSLQE